MEWNKYLTALNHAHESEKYVKTQKSMYSMIPFMESLKTCRKLKNIF